MPKFNADLIVTQQGKRYYHQNGGGSPLITPSYGGVSAQFMSIESVTNPITGGRTRINAQDPRKAGRYLAVGSTSAPPEFPTATVKFMQNKGVLPRSLYDLGSCKTTFYELTGECGDPSDFVNGWNDYVKVLSNGEATSVTEGGGAFDADAGVMDDIAYTFDSSYTVGKLGFGEKAAVEIYSEVIDITYQANENCAGCGPNDDGTQRIYAVTNNTSASAGEAPSIVYSVNGGGSWVTLAITGATSTDVPKAIETVGSRLVVLFDDGATGGYFVTSINRITGVPVATWSKVTTGFVSGNAPNDIYAASQAQIFFAADGGYIYESSQILAGVTVTSNASATSENLVRIDGSGETLVAVGENATVLYSVNEGRTFATVENAPGAANIVSVSVTDDFSWVAVDTDGVVYFSDSQGQAAWLTVGLPTASGAITGGHDVLFINQEVGYLSLSTGSAGIIYSTWNGGASWAVSSDAGTPRLVGFPVLDRVNRLAAPDLINQSKAANNLACAGLAGNGTDGIIVLGVAAVK